MTRGCQQLHRGASSWPTRTARDRERLLGDPCDRSKTCAPLPCCWRLAAFVSKHDLPPRPGRAPNGRPRRPPTTDGAVIPQCCAGTAGIRKPDAHSHLAEHPQRGRQTDVRSLSSLHLGPQACADPRSKGRHLLAEPQRLTGDAKNFTQPLTVRRSARIAPSTGCCARTTAWVCFARTFVERRCWSFRDVRKPRKQFPPSGGRERSTGS